MIEPKATGKKKRVVPPKVMAPPPVPPPPKDGVPSWARDLAQRAWDKYLDDPGYASNTKDFVTVEWRVDEVDRLIWRRTPKRQMTVDQDGIRVDMVGPNGEIIPMRGASYPWPRQPRSRGPSPVRVA